MSECSVVYVESGRIVKKEIVNGELVSVVKGLAKRLLEEWNPEMSDFIVLKDQYTISLRIPISRDVLDRLSRYSHVRRVGDKAEASIPVYEITYSNKWTEDTLQTDRLVVILPNINDEITDNVVNNIIAMFSERKGEEEILEE